MMTKTKSNRILHIIPSITIGGAEKLLLDTINLFPEFEHHVVAFNADPSFLKQFQEKAFVHIRKSTKVATVSNILYVRSLAKKIQPFIIHSHLLKANWLSRFAFYKKKNVFNSIHSPYGKDAFAFHRYTLWVEKYSFYFSKAKLLFVSNYVKEDYNQYIMVGERGMTLPNFIPDTYFALEAKKYTPSNPLRLVAVGNVKPLKNYGLLIEAFKQLKEHPISLDVYGTGSLIDEYRNEVREHSLNINFKGSTGSALDVLGNYHALLFPSLYEGFSLALLEAMAARMPLVLSEIPMFKELTRGNAYFFNPENIDECVRAISRLYHEGFSNSWVDSNKNYVREKFSAALYKKKLATVYELFS